MTARELNAAGIHTPALRDAYARCRQLNASNGKTYFLATRLLTSRQRPAIHALYGFARWADDIVDDLDPTISAQQRAAALLRLDDTLQDALSSGHSAHPVIAALVDTVTRHRIDPRHFTDFMSSMRMDLHVTDYPTFEDLRGYMYGSAAVIGLQVLPVLGTVTAPEEAAPHAASLGIAFQLTNFLRDVGEDLDRDRIYLPQDRLAAHGVDRELLAWCRRSGHTDPRVRAALRDMINTTRDIYRHAARGIPILHPVSRPCVETAYILYQAILDHIEAADCAITNRRTVVPRHRRAAIAFRGFTRIGISRAYNAMRATADTRRPPQRKTAS
ncbi:MAG TPA: phytoene synthase [Streptomyces sp.]|nr:phytoene synthase [Streptomyces sp.]